MALTTHQEIVLKAMQTMKPAQQGAIVKAVIRLAATWAKNQLHEKAEKRTPSKEAVVPARSVKEPTIPSNLKRSGLKSNLRAKPARRSVQKGSAYGLQHSQVPASPHGSVPLRTDAKFDPKDTEWLFSENRGRRKSSPARSAPSGQKWATNRFNRSSK